MNSAFIALIADKLQLQLKSSEAADFYQLKQTPHIGEKHRYGVFFATFSVCNLSKCAIYYLQATGKT